MAPAAPPRRRWTRLAAAGVRFATAVAHAPLTAPSHASMLTGRTPLGHGVRDNGAYVLPATVRSVAEDFRAAGYKTAAFVSGFPLTRRFGFDRGFETYDDHLPRGSDPRRTAYVERSAAGTTDAALPWLDATPARRAVLPVGALLRRPRAVRAAGGVRGPRRDPRTRARSRSWTPRSRGSPAASRRAPGRALVLVTADHGESLGEHGEDTHGIFLYDATLRVPFLLAGPGVPAGQVAATVARGIDVAPTLLDLAGLLRRAAMEGRSLRPALSGERMEDAPTYAESLHSQLQYGWAPLHSLRTARYKLIEAPRPELYDLAARTPRRRPIARPRTRRAWKGCAASSGR